MKALLDIRFKQLLKIINNFCQKVKLTLLRNNLLFEIKIQIKTFLYRVKSILLQVKHEKPIFFWLSCFGVVLLLTASLVLPPIKSSNIAPPSSLNTIEIAREPVTNALEQRINDLDARSITLAKQIAELKDTATIASDMVDIDTKFSQLDMRLSQVASIEAVNHLQEIYQTELENIKQQYNEFLALFKHLESQLSHTEIVDQQAILPFSVTAIDRWGEAIYATLNLGSNRHALVAVGESKAGWKVQELNHRTKTALFINIKTGQAIHIMLDY